MTSGARSHIFPAAPDPDDGPAIQATTMVSSTRQTERRRAINKSRLGRPNKKARVRAGTPTFPVHPEGYDPGAADAKKAK